MLHRTMSTLLAALALTAASPAAADAPGVAGHDDPTTLVGEAATLDTSRMLVQEPTERTSMELARAYADRRGLVSCGSPEDAELDDVFLARNVHPVDGMPYNDVIHEVGLDEALESAGKRIVILACERA